MTEHFCLHGQGKRTKHFRLFLALVWILPLAGKFLVYCVRNLDYLRAIAFCPTNEPQYVSSADLRAAFSYILSQFGVLHCKK